MMQENDEFCARNYAPLPVTLVRGEGVHVWDEQGRQYLDMMSAYSAVSHGHSHPRLVAALTEQAQRLAIVSRAFNTDKLAPFLRRACRLTGMDMALPMNTGAEAVETALKAARKWSYQVKGVTDDECEIIACEGNFHGRTLGAIALSTQSQYRNGFGPFSSGVRIVPYGDARALERAITPNTAAFLLEPMQGEAGIRIPPAGYLAHCAELGAYLLEELRSIRSPLIREVRGKGLWCGVDFDPARVRARAVAERLLANGILTKETHDTVIRLAPPLIIERAQLDWALERFREVLQSWGDLALAS